ncbi:low molecular weight protein tyrosine phosphatase family protein [Alkalimarinus coralli]|uniref:low molecular weight protein tyrosine phosphatase family protein n=1 Tax=Alkalimarinus coralli TaxID=2935863 RepID=UPI00202B0ACB|nr:phosphotyrosine protein phosphatase [Alkalimarinus coralli]
MDESKRNILFICSKNQWRSPTAETIWRKHPSLNVRSAGTSQKARKTVNAKDIAWADVIFVMEEKHKNRLKADFSRMLSHKTIYVLDIPDEYQYMDSNLIDELESTVAPLLDV